MSTGVSYSKQFIYFILFDFFFKSSTSSSSSSSSLSSSLSSPSPSSYFYWLTFFVVITNDDRYYFISTGVPYSKHFISTNWHMLFFLNLLRIHVYMLPYIFELYQITVKIVASDLRRLSYCLITSLNHHHHHIFVGLHVCCYHAY